MATAAADASAPRLALAALLWVVVGAWAFHQLPPDGSAGLLLGGFWAALLALRHLPWTRWGVQVPSVAGLCCPAAQPRASDLGMGWMMGTLWWHTEACVGRLAPPTLWVGVHLLGMAALLVTLPRAQRLGSTLTPTHLAWGALATASALAAWLLTAPQPAVAWLAMVALTVAWVIEPPRRTPLGWPEQGAWLLAGPLGLWLIHQRWPTAGPDALWQAVLVLGVGHTAWAWWQRTRHPTLTYPFGGSA